MTVSELGERALLARIQAQLNVSHRPPAGLVLGIGDDGAVVAPGRAVLSVLTTDAHIEGVHFDRRWSTWSDIGFRALAVNFSDLAAMGALPRWVLLSLALPGNLAVVDVEALAAEIGILTARAGAAVIGGNLTRTPGPVTIDITAVGEVHPRRVLTRAGGRPGDRLMVSGAVGSAKAGRERLESGVEAQSPSSRADQSTVPAPDQDTTVERYRRPEPRLRLGRAVANASAARAAIDVSDGLAEAAWQLAEASGCGVEIDAEALPIAPTARDWWQRAGRDPEREAIDGSDDYELLLAVPQRADGRLREARRHAAEPALTSIGVLTRDKHGVLKRGDKREDLPRGFGHW